MALETLNPDRVEAVLMRHGAQSVTYSDAGDGPVFEPGPGETPLWRDTQISGLFPPGADFDALRQDLMAEFDVEELPAVGISELADRDWQREWLRDFGPMQFGSRLWVCPGDATVEDPAAAVVRLDPGLAFGTGTHATTALCLEWLDALPLAGRTLLDYGCGSGILAIAGIKLGCSHALAADIDPQAMRATTDNARRNSVTARLATTIDPAGIEASFDVVVANILAAPLIELAAGIAQRVKSGCSIALSGILSGQVGEVLEAYRPWIAFDEPVEREQGGQIWARLSGRRTRG